MSTKPNPVASTAAMLALRFARLDSRQGRGSWSSTADQGHTHEAAALASDLHRLAPAVQRHAVALCNGEWRDGQRSYLYRQDNPKDGVSARVGELEKSIEDYGAKLDRRIAKLNAKLAPLALQANRSGDPRGTVLRLTSTDADRPVPCNCGDGESWAIA